jgi:hypothetical protein
MLDLSQEERNLLNSLQKTNMVIRRQADDFTLYVGTKKIRTLKTKVCLRLIELGALIVKTSSDTEWIYIADRRIFAPNFEIEE